MPAVSAAIQPPARSIEGMREVSSMSLARGVLAVSHKSTTDVDLVDSASGINLGRLAGAKVPPSQLAFSPDGDFLGALGEEGAVTVWRVADRSLSGEVRLPDKITGFALFPGAETVALGDETGQLVVAEVATSQVVTAYPTRAAIEKAFEEKRADVTDVCVDPDGRHVAALAGSELLMLVSTGPTPKLEVVPSSDLGFHQVAFSPDGRYLLAASGKMTVSVQIDPGASTNVEISELGGALLVWDLSTGQRRTGTVSGAMFDGAAFSHDASHVAVMELTGGSGDEILWTSQIFARDSIGPSLSLSSAESTVELVHGMPYPPRALDPATGELFLAREDRIDVWYVLPARPPAAAPAPPAAAGSGAPAGPDSQPASRGTTQSE